MQTPSREEPEAAWIRWSLGRALEIDGSAERRFLQQYLEKALFKTQQGVCLFVFVFVFWMESVQSPDKNVLSVTTAKAVNWGVRAWVRGPWDY